MEAVWARARVPLRVAKAVRQVWPDHLPVFVTVSATNWADDGWDLAQSIVFSGWLKDIGVDLIDCSSGGLVPGVKIPVEQGYQVSFAAAIRKKVGIATGAVGMISEPMQAEQIISSGEADAVFLARAMLRDPYWPLHASKELKPDTSWPAPYLRAKD